MRIAWWEGFLLRPEFAACVVYVEIATGENIFTQILPLVGQDAFSFEIVKTNILCRLC